MAAGTPALVGDYAAAREVLGDSALLVDPYDADAIADGLRTLASDEQLRQRLVQAGRVQVSQFTWDRTARRTLEVYRDALA